MADIETIALVKDIEVDKYKYGFTTDIESEYAPKGLNEDTVRFISNKKSEPAWMLDGAPGGLSPLAADGGADLGQGRTTRRSTSRTSITTPRPRASAAPKSLDEVDPKLLETYAKLGIPLKEQEILAGVRKQGEKSELDEEGSEYASGKVAIDAVFDSVSVVTTFKAELAKAGVIFCSISEALREHPELVKKYLFSVVPQGDNYYAALNAAVFSDGSFVYVPPGVRCPMELSTYFRMNAKNTGQFERTLIIADKGSYVSYLEGCTAPTRDESQLHAAVVELIAHGRCRDQVFDRAELVPRRRRGQGRHLQLRHQARRLPRAPLEDLLDAGGDRLRHHLEIPELHPARRRLARRVLFDRHFQRPPAGRLRHQDDPSRQEHVEPHHLQGHRGGPLRQHLSRPRLGPPQGAERAQLHAVRLAADRRQVRRAHRALHRGQDLDRAVRARGDDVEDLRRPDVLLHVARA